jgi:hypothetical protein
MQGARHGTCVGTGCTVACAKMEHSRSRVLRWNISGHRLPGCGCVGPTRALVPLRGVYVTLCLV